MHSPLLKLLVWLVLGLSGSIGSAAEKPAPTPTHTNAVTQVDDRSLLARETKQYVAQLTEERNQLRSVNEAYAMRQGLLIAYSVVLTLLVAWLMMRALARPATVGATATTPGTDTFAASNVQHETTVTVRKNATITIRNGATQQAEMTDQVQTRRAFARSDTGSLRKETATVRKNATASISRTPTPPRTAVIAPELEPARPAAPTTVAPVTNAISKPPTRSTQRPTVRVEQSSDRLVPVEVAVKPGTAPLRRTSGPVAET